MGVNGLLYGVNSFNMYLRKTEFSVKCEVCDTPQCELRCQLSGLSVTVENVENSSFVSVYMSPSLES